MTHDKRLEPLDSDYPQPPEPEPHPGETDPDWIAEADA